MARYRKIDPRIWNDERFRAFTDDGKLAFVFVLTHPAMTAVGAMRGTAAGLGAELGWPPERMVDAMRDAIRQGMVDVDPKACFIGAPNFLRYNEPEGPNSVAKAWVEALDLVPECRGKRKVIARCRAYLAQKSKAFREALPDAIWDAFPEAIGDASPIQEQEQEPEQKTAAERPRKREVVPQVETPEPEKQPAKEVVTPRPLHVLPPPDEAPKPRRFPIADMRELGPLGAEYRGLLERELGRGLAVAATGDVEAVRVELEQLLERPGYGGVERALAWTVTTLAARRRSKAPEPGSVRYLLPLLRSMPAPEVGALERVRAECPEWAAVLDAAMALPTGNAPTQYQLDDVLLPLRATFVRGELHLVASDEYQRGFVADTYLDGLTRLARETIGPHVLVHLTAAAPEAEAAHA